jgi:antitoxin HigA-1
MKKLSPVHPGQHLRETLQELDISTRQFAFHIGTTPMRLSLVLRGLRPVSADLALRLEKALGQSAGYWMNLQTRYDLDATFDRTQEELTAIRPLEHIHA